MNLEGTNVLLGVTSGVAIYKACALIGRLRYMGADVKVVMTQNSTELITAQYFAELTSNPVAVEMFAPIEQHEVQHISLAKWASVVVIYPATYNIIGKIANGVADDMLTTVIAAVPAREKFVVIAPAMNTVMWENPILERNMTYLKSIGNYRFIPPTSGKLACGDEGVGKLVEPAVVTDYLEKLFV